MVKSLEIAILAFSADGLPKMNDGEGLNMDKVQVGDWICFLILGQPSIGKVEYVLGARIITTIGEARLIDILEVRPPAERKA